MTGPELASVLRRLADALDTLGNEPLYTGKKPFLEGDNAVGAALLWSYLRDLFTGDGGPEEKSVFTREEVLVVLDLVSRDHDIFPPGLCDMVTMADNNKQGE